MFQRDRNSNCQSIQVSTKPGHGRSLHETRFNALITIQLIKGYDPEKTVNKMGKCTWYSEPNLFFSPVLNYDKRSVQRATLCPKHKYVFHGDHMKS